MELLGRTSPLARAPTALFRCGSFTGIFRPLGAGERAPLGARGTPDPHSPLHDTRARQSISFDGFLEFVTSIQAQEATLPSSSSWPAELAAVDLGVPPHAHILGRA